MGVLGGLGKVLRVLGAVLGRSWAVLGGLGAVLGRSWAVLARSWVIFGRFLGTFRGTFFCPLLLAVLAVCAVLAVLAVCAVPAVWAVLAVRVLWAAASDFFGFGLYSGCFARFELFGLLGAIAADI